jgi:hypothetical protein
VSTEYGIRLDAIVMSMYYDRGVFLLLLLRWVYAQQTSDAGWEWHRESA